MSRQPRQGGATSSRQNDYFVPRDGIDREVISADICRYLGNDALVRPGHYEDPQTGQVVQGYYITAYRNLTTAMIEDLKADSARWESERRVQTSRNSSGVQYRMSETHQSRQHHGPTEPPYAPDPYARDSAFDGPRYPGSGAPGYTGAAGGYPPSYGGGSGGGYGYQQPQQSPQPDPRYSSGSFPPPMDQRIDPRAYPNQDGNSGHGPFVHTHANIQPRPYGSNDSYSSGRMPTNGANPTQPIYANAPPATQPGYPTTTSPFNHPAGQVPTSAAPYSSFTDADATYGRAGQANPQAAGYPPGQQYGEPTSSRTSVPPQSSNPAPSNGAAKRRSDRDDDRHTSSDRHHRQPRR